MLERGSKTEYDMFKYEQMDPFHRLPSQNHQDPRLKLSMTFQRCLRCWCEEEVKCGRKFSLMVEKRPPSHCLILTYVEQQSSCDPFSSAWTRTPLTYRRGIIDSSPKGRLIIEVLITRKPGYQTHSIQENSVKWVCYLYWYSD